MVLSRATASWTPRERMLGLAVCVLAVSQFFAMLYIFRPRPGRKFEILPDDTPGLVSFNGKIPDVWPANDKKGWPVTSYPDFWKTARRVALRSALGTTARDVAPDVCEAH